MLDVSLPAAALGGLISFLSPCVLPLVPPYLSFLAGVSLDELQAGDDWGVRRRAIVTALLFVAGFSTVFVLLGATASALGLLVRQYVDVLSTIAGLAIIVMGLHFLGPILAAILAVAGSETSVARGAVLLAFYSAGLGIPFVLAAFAMKPLVGLLKRMRSRFAVVEKTMGALLVLTGLAFLSGWMTTASFWLL